MTSAKASLLDQMIVSGSNFLVFVLAARFLETAEVAKYAYAFGFYMLVFMVANAWIYQNIMSIGQQKMEGGESLPHFSGLNLLLVLSSLPVSLFLFKWLASDGLFNVPWLEAVLVAVFVAVNQLVDFERRVLYFVSHSPFAGPVTVSMSGFLLRIIAMILIQPESFDSFMLILIVFSLPGLFFAVRRFSLSIFRKDLLDFSCQQINDGKWMTVNIPGNWAWGQAPVFIVGAVLGLQAAGIYAAVRSIANLANVAMEMIPTYFASRLSRLYTTGQLSAYKRYLFVSVGLGLLVWGTCLVMVLLWGGDILVIILGGDFSSYSTLFALFWVFNVFIFLTRVQFLHLRFVEKTGIIPLANLGGVVALCGSYFVWFSEMGITGMAWAMIIGGGVIVMVQFFGLTVYNKHKGISNAS